MSATQANSHQFKIYHVLHSSLEFEQKLKDLGARKMPPTHYYDMGTNFFPTLNWVLYDMSETACPGQYKSLVHGDKIYDPYTKTIVSPIAICILIGPNTHQYPGFIRRLVPVSEGDCLDMVQEHLA